MLGLDQLMSNEISKLPNITLSDISADVAKLLDENKIVFKPLEEAPWWLRKFSALYHEYYFSYKNTLYVAPGHIALATSKKSTDRIIATSKVLPWVYAIKNKSCSSIFNFLNTMLNTEIRSYYFLFEFSMLKAHDVPEIPDLIAIGFLSSRKGLFGEQKNPNEVMRVLKHLLATKVNKEL